MDFKDILAEEILAKKKQLEQSKTEKLALKSKSSQVKEVAPEGTISKTSQQVVLEDSEENTATKRKHSDEEEVVALADSDDIVQIYFWLFDSSI